MLGKYFRVKSLEEATDLLEKYKENNPLLLAGGTDIMVKERDGFFNTNNEYKNPFIIDINPLKKDLGKINLLENGKGENFVEIGSLATYTDLLESKIVSAFIPLAAKASFAVGGRQIQNMGTIGGMLGTATPAADVTLALLSLNADVTLLSRKKERTIPLKDFFTGYRKTERKSDEIITKIICPVQKNNEKFDYKKVGGRKGQIIAVSAFCGRLIINSDRIIEAYISAGSSAPYSIRLYKVEEFLKNKNFSKLVDDEKQLTQIIDQSLSPIDEVIATADYKRHCVKNLILDFLLERK